MVPARPGNTMAAEPRLSSARVPSFDGLRGLAVLAVVCFHTLRITPNHSWWTSVWAAIQESSWIGVDLFFVLSGFLITGILLDSRESPHYFVNFYARRTLRIFPLYYAVLAVSLLIVPAAIGLTRLPMMYSRLLERQVWLWAYMANYLQAREPHTLPGFGHFWSLAVEEQFYLAWPLVVYLTSRRKLLAICATICAFLPILRLVMLLHGSSTWALRQYTFTRIDTLLFGAIAAIALRDARVRSRLSTLIPYIAFAAVIALGAFGYPYGFLPFEGPTMVVAGYSVLGILFAAVMFAIATGAAGRRLPGLLCTAPARWFGKYSYAIYIFHWPVAQGVRAVADRFPFFRAPQAAPVACYFVIVLATTSAAAWISWHCFESRFLRLKRYFEQEGPRSVPPPAEIEQRFATAPRTNYSPAAP